jgi:ABC-2 type transport system ATP-binding protein
MDHGPEPPAIDVIDLTRTFTIGRRSKRTTVEAVRGISLRVAAGERLAFIGPNGAGKSTSIKMLTGILFPSAGQATVLGLTPWHERARLATRIGAVFGQRSQLWPELPARATFKMLYAIYGLERSQLDRRVAELGELLDAIDLYDQPVRTLSLGQRMRCELTACLLHSPDLLFLDEPSIGLDLVAKQQFRQLLVDLNTELGCTIFLTSHDVADIEHVADRVIIVNHGAIIYDASVQSMRQTLLRTKKVEVHFTEPVAKVELPDAATVIHMTPGLVVLEVDTAQLPIREVLHQVLRHGRVADLNVVDPPLEQVIGEIYQRPRHEVE